MITFEREEIREHPILNAAILFQHIIDQDVHSILFEQRTPVKGASLKRGYFRMMHGSFVHYHIQHTVVNVERHGIALKLIKIQFYDDFIEYEATRIRTLQSVPTDQQWGLNLN